MGYNQTFAYNSYGDPISVTGDTFYETPPPGAPTASPIPVTPTLGITYDNRGDVVCSNNGIGTYAVAYDTIGRETAVANPDDGSSLSTSTCGKPSNSKTTVSYTSYFPNGQVQFHETPYQHSLDQQSNSYASAVAYTYDIDGNVTTENRNFDNAGSTTTKWYDAAERLVQIGMAQDARQIPLFNYSNFTWSQGNIDNYTYQWLRRYFYDLSSGSNVFNQTTSITAHGNLFKTQEWLAAAVQPAATSPPTWMDVTANAYDALDRATAKYNYLPGTTTVEMTTSAYDGSGANGMLTQTCDALSECANRAYDGIGRLSSITFVGDGGVTPASNYGYDADGRTISIASPSSFGTQGYAYDADGPRSGGWRTACPNFDVKTTTKRS